MQIRSIDPNELAEILENTLIHHTIDTGVAFVHCGKHPVMGDISLVATCTDSHVLMTL